MRILNVQPVLASYRVPFFEGLASDVDVSSLVVFSDHNSKFGSYAPSGCHVELADWYSVKGLFFPRSLRKYCDLLGASTHVIHFADFKYSTLWLGLVYAKLMGVRFFLHGQGGYKGRQGIAKRIVYFFSVLMSDGYICYTEYSKKNLLRLLPKFLHGKVSVARNSLYLDACSVYDSSSLDVFYVGRLREGNGLNLVLEAAKLLGLVVHVIGEGDARQSLEREYTTAIFYGAVFDEAEQQVIASKCMAGVYGGDAGLSVVHYMSLGLPVVVHSSIKDHMGPEPSYVIDGYNGLLFQRSSTDSLKSALFRLQADSALRDRLSDGAQKTFVALSEPPMHKKFIQIMGL
ncbi:MAG: glycosyltransferase [Thalassolituus sp.]|uniref:glycosyltransferase n=1 Tax=Thalassolituus sp. TaxID=2030822 RepID=UPI003981F5B9